MSFQRVCTTRTFARNFCPEVGQFFEFHCPLSNKDSCSLAEILETAELFIEFWHQVPAGKDSYFDKFIYGMLFIAFIIYRYHQKNGRRTEKF